MWVLSQDKTLFVECHAFTICEIIKDNHITKYSIDSESYELGVYDTKNQAMKVLDLIQFSIEHNQNTFTMPDFLVENPYSCD